MKKVAKSFLIFLLIFNFSVSIGQEFSFICNEVERNYLVRLPQNYNLEDQFPLVMVFHGFGLSKEFMDTCIGFTQHADTTGYIVVYPQGVNKDWIKNDVIFVSTLIDTLCKNYKINRKQIYVAGHSRGGELVNNLACTLNNKIAAFADISCYFGDRYNCNLSQPVPFLKIYGTLDALYELVIDVELPFWKENNNVPTLKDSLVLPDVVTSDSSYVVKYTYGEGNSEIVFYKIVNGGHGIPGWCLGNDRGFTNRDISAPQVLWDFFKNHELDNVENTLGLNLLESGKRWSILKKWMVFLTSGDDHQWTEFDMFSGDTIINSKLYKKALQSEDSLMDNWTVIGYVREASTGLYFMDKEGQEDLIYEYKLELGDSVTIPDESSYWTTKLVVGNIDSVMMNGKYRKRFTLDYPGGTHADTWIEGIGSIHGILSTRPTAANSIQTELLCYYEDDTLIYKKPNRSKCYYRDLPVSVRENKFEHNEIKIFPNPVTDKMKVVFNTKKCGYFKTCNIYGKTIEVIDISEENEMLIDVSGYPKGIYYVVMNCAQSAISQKFVKF